MWGGINRRKFPRVNYPCLVIIRGNHENQEAILTQTENVGIGGVGVILKKELKIFSPVELELDLMDMQPHIKCEGKVVWVVKSSVADKKKGLFFDIGVEFDNLKEQEKNRINFVVNRLLGVDPTK